jgi:hypothetical protein
MIFSLAEDLHNTLTLIPDNHPRRRNLTLLEEAIHRDIHLFNRHPTLLFQCIWNTCWQCDGEEMTRHYKMAEIARQRLGSAHVR